MRKSKKIRDSKLRVDITGFTVVYALVSCSIKNLQHNVNLLTYICGDSNGYY